MACSAITVDAPLGTGCVSQLGGQWIRTTQTAVISRTHTSVCSMAHVPLDARRRHTRNSKARRGAQRFRVIGGSQVLSTTIAHAVGARVRLSTPVTHVRNWNGNGPVVVTTEHGTLRAKRIVTVLSPSQAHVIDFEPPCLPNARRSRGVGPPRPTWLSRRW